ncbi:MAG: hypothetical protein ACYDD1_14450 [Caulobacteraceae bacterium]
MSDLEKRQLDLWSDDRAVRIARKPLKAFKPITSKWSAMQMIDRGAGSAIIVSVANGIDGFVTTHVSNPPHALISSDPAILADIKYALMFAAACLAAVIWKWEPFWASATILVWSIFEASCYLPYYLYGHFVGGKFLCIQVLSISLATSSFRGALALRKFKLINGGEI